MSKPWRVAGITLVILAIASLIVANLFVVYISNRDNKGYTTIGVPGSPGSEGRQGPAGDNGASGQDGRDGLSGQNGQNGKNGKNGINGTDGASGRDGADGVNGADGRTPEFSCSGNTLYWRYIGDETWRPLGTVLSCTTLQLVGE